jgi:hypothetical protein
MAVCFEKVGRRLVGGCEQAAHRFGIVWIRLGVERLHQTLDLTLAK